MAPECVADPKGQSALKGIRKRLKRGGDRARELRSEKNNIGGNKRKGSAGYLREDIRRY